MMDFSKPIIGKADLLGKFFKNEKDIVLQIDGEMVEVELLQPVIGDIGVVVLAKDGRTFELDGPASKTDFYLVNDKDD